MNWHAIKVIYKYEMLRTWNTLLQSIASPVISTSLYFVVFGAAIEHVINERAAAGLADPEVLTPLVGPACTVSFFGLRWPIADVSSVLHLSPEAVEHHLERARRDGA